MMRSIILGAIFSTMAMVPAQVSTVQIKSSIDGTMQPAKYYNPGKPAPVPLLVALHTWSHDYTQTDDLYKASVQWAADSGWAFVFPNFRGPNNNPEACGSKLAVQDILDAVRFIQDSLAVDTNRIYLTGVSGGGYAALLMAGQRPNLWAGVSAWVPITDLQAWYSENKGNHYSRNVAACVGGDPVTDSTAKAEAKKRSPLTYLNRSLNLPIDLNAGIHDGHSGSVPISHTLNAFNAVAKAEDTISADHIEAFVADEAVPAALSSEKQTDRLYGTKLVLFRRESNKKRVTIFEGGHEGLPKAALAWLSRQRKIPKVSVKWKSGNPGYDSGIFLKTQCIRIAGKNTMQTPLRDIKGRKILQNTPQANIFIYVR